MKKKLINEAIRQIDIYEFDNNIDDLIDYLKSLKDEFYMMYSCLYIDVICHYDSIECILSGDRLETDEEVKKRIENEKQEKLKKKQQKDKEIEEVLKKAKKLGLKISQ